MKHLLDVRPCDACGGPHYGVFQLVRMSMAVVNVQAVNEFAGMHQFFGGRASDALVENFSPAAASVVNVAMDSDDPEQKALMTELVLCLRCYCTPLVLGELADRRRAD
jgi:hypothetical protein